jgi:hypothetical protein
MGRIASIVLRHVLLVGIALPVMDGAARAETQAQRTREMLARWPLIFFVAKGEPNACGPGCSEWIAADGAFDRAAPTRLAELLGTLNNRNLPIFFNSRGGNVGAANAIARMLREHRITAGVGRTLLAGCRGNATYDESCRGLMQSKPGLKARLRTADADCLSACVFALIGASVRQVAAGARLGIHSPHLYTEVPQELAPKMEAVFRLLKLNAIELGVDPALVDASAKVPSNSAHILSRSQIARFGIETRAVYETAWVPDPFRANAVLKSVTQPKGADGKEYRTSRVRMACVRGGSRVAFEYWRELASNEVGVATAVRVTAGESELMLGDGGPIGREDVRSALTGAVFLRNAMASPSIVVVEAFTPTDAPGWSREVKLSTAGFSKALEGLLKECGKLLEGTGSAGGR